MNKAELKAVLKPLIKECIKEAIFEEGVLSGIITEVAQGLTAGPCKQPQEGDPIELQNRDLAFLLQLS